ncbi:hypothetical protein PS704_04625 [Pseudomonas fluorescens]|uniref:Uncharacterized protein n=1 Tax=Pseudomonas fluorescens TaxID=294 RepID=A0A5E7EHK9_PSEFL|nr:hypothetical protein PS704_04625 [Pseudomonas fluorescens]
MNVLNGVGNRCSRCCSGWRRSSGRRCSCLCWRGSSRGRSARHFQFQDQVAGADFVVELDADALDYASGRRWDFHAGLVGFQGDQRLVGGDGVACLDQYFDDLGLARRTDVRDMNVLNGVGNRCSRCCSGWRRSSGRRCSCLCWRGSSRGRSARHFQFQDQVAGADFVVELDADALDYASGRRWDFHAGLVGFQGDQRLVGGDGVACLDQYFDDLGLARRTDVRDMNVLNGVGNRCSRCCSGWRRSSGRRCSCLCWRGSSRGRSARHFQFQDQVAGADFVVELDADALDYASGRRWDFHAGLVGFQGDQRLISLDGVADLDLDLDDLGLARRTDVRHVHLLSRSGSRRGCWRWSSGRSSGRFLFSFCSWRSGSRRGRRSGTFDFQLQQFVAFFQTIAQLHFQALDDTGLRRRHFHARLVRFQRQDALVGFDTVADLYKQFNYFTFTAADVRYANEFAHRISPQQSSGLRFSGLIPNLAMASATTLGSMSPRSANASRAANTTK